MTGESSGASADADSSMSDTSVDCVTEPCPHREEERPRLKMYLDADRDGVIDWDITGLDHCGSAVRRNSRRTSLPDITFVDRSGDCRHSPGTVGSDSCQQCRYRILSYLPIDRMDANLSGSSGYRYRRPAAVRNSSPGASIPTC